MRQYIRDIGTGKYFAGQGEWTLDVHLAHQFVDVRELLQTVHALGLTNVEEVLYFGDEPDQWEVVLPIRNPNW